MKTLQLVFLLVAALVSGCVSFPSPKASAFHVRPTITKKVLMTVVESRNYVLVKDKEEPFEFLTRIYGIPMSQSNFERRPFSAYISDRIAEGLREQGVEVRSFQVKAGASPVEVINATQCPDDTTLLVFVMTDLRSDWPGIPGRTSYWFDFSLHAKRAGQATATSEYRNYEEIASGAALTFNVLLPRYERDLKALVADPRLDVLFVQKG
jgi:hypothetical protein